MTLHFMLVIKIWQHSLECAANRAVEWFKQNHMKLNPDKSHLLVSGHKHECILANTGGTPVIELYQEKLLGISVDRDLTFENHVNAGRKLNALSRQCKILPFYKRKS